MLTQYQCERILSAASNKGYAEAGKVAVSMLREESQLRGLLIEIDAVLSAVAHRGRKVDRQAVVGLYGRLRDAIHTLD